METPTLKEVKEYFKNAKEVKCANSNDIGFVEIDKIKENKLYNGTTIGYVQNPREKNWLILWDSQKGYAEIISCKEDFETPKHYDNSKGTLYKIATERGWNSYLFDIVKRLERAEKKGEFKTDLEKSINVIKLWLQENDN